MNINLIKTAIEKYLCATENDNEKLACADALKEIACTMDRNEFYDVWDNEAVLIPIAAWIDILDDMTYDILGERMKMYGEATRPAHYYHDVRKKCGGLELVATQYLECGFELLSDRWMDNEDNGCHDSMGHLKGTTLTGDKATYAWRLIAAQDPEIMADICGISVEEAEALIKEANEE